MRVEVLQIRRKFLAHFHQGTRPFLEFCKREGSSVMQATVTPQQRQAAKCEIVRQIEQGASTYEAWVRSSVPMHRTTVYRLLKRMQREGENGFADRRHGHPVKLRGEALTLLKEHCQSNPSASSSAVQRLLQERLDLCISISQLNRVRAKLGLSRCLVPRGKKPKTSLSIEPGYHEQASGLLLLAAANETKLLDHLTEALPSEQTEEQPPFTGSSVAVRRQLLLTLLFLRAVGLHRTWDLRGYTADGLALLTGRTRAYGYRYTDAFLSQVARADGAERYTDALACWTTHLWHPPAEGTGGTEETVQPHALTRLLWMDIANPSTVRFSFHAD